MREVKKVIMDQLIKIDSDLDSNLDLRINHNRELHYINKTIVKLNKQKDELQKGLEMLNK